MGRAAVGGARAEEGCDVTSDGGPVPDAEPQGWGRAAAGEAVVAAVARATHLVALEVVGVVGSTQDAARERAATGAPGGTLFVAEHQTRGRGRLGRSWDDDGRAGASLAATLLLEPTVPSPLLPHALGLAVLDAVTPWLEGRAALKWPNDVVVRLDGGPRKVAGLLVEREDRVGPAARTVLLAGIGVNVDRRHLPEAPDRVGVADLALEAVDPSDLLARLVAGLDAALSLLEAGAAPLMARYRAVSDTHGRDVHVVLADGAELEGVAEIDDDGRLVVDSVLGRHTVLAGTVRDAGVEVAPA